MENHKIRLTLFEERFGWGGIETFICNVCTKIDLDRYNVRIVVVNKVTDHFDLLLESRGIKMDVLLPKIESNPIKRFEKGLPKFKDYLKSHSCDIIHFNLSNSIDMQYVKLAKKEGVRNRIVHSHNSSATNKKKLIAHKIGMLFWSHSANYYMACSNKAAKWLFPVSIYRNKKYSLIRNAIETSKYVFDQDKRDNIRTEYGWNNKIVFGEVGRFNLQKNHIFLIDIFSEIIKIKPNAVLVLVGEGELQEQIINYVNKKGITESVEFLGTSSRVPELLQGFDLFMLPSLYEGLPFVMVEAQAASLPILASNTITREIGLTRYVNYYSLKKSFIEWAKKAIECTTIARKNDISTLKEAGFDLTVMIQKLSEIYESILVGEKL